MFLIGKICKIPCYLLVIKKVKDLEARIVKTEQDEKER